ncbi:MAG: phosphoribosylformylglycinamidine synthase subunit PurQ [Capsulimonadales bacterium]|nr:phosphoribosylformylglycinamidine synthase subunit PurQ [Capsulimonadales bacterium]
MADADRSRPLRIGVIVFPGSNCDTDAGNAWTELGLGEAVYLWHQETDLKGVDALLLPGGFSYGDALRAGAIARFAPIMNEVVAFAADGGVVAAICNGFQIACEAGLLPGALARNENLRFVSRFVSQRVENNETLFTRRYSQGEVIRIPVAHGEGRYVCDDATYERLVAENRIVFRYADDNPNGSRNDVAGIVGGPRNNVLGMMPHPERAVRSLNGFSDGARFFRSIADTLIEHTAPALR